MFLLKLLFWLILAYGVIGLILSFIPIDFEDGKSKRKILFPYRIPAIIFGIIMIFIFSTIVKIDGQRVGILVKPTGVSQTPLKTGWHFVMFWNDVFEMDKTVWVYTCANNVKEGQKPDADAIWSPTKDGIKMGCDVSVSWRIDEDAAPWIYQNVTENDEKNKDGRYYWLEDNVIRPKLKSTLALTISEFSPIEVYSSKRSEIQQEVTKKLNKELSAYRIKLQQVDIREVYYNPEYEKAINNKKLAEQEVMRLIEVTRQKEEQLKQSEIDKNIAIQQAEGESKALQIKGNSISSNPKIIELEWINKWDGKLPQYIMGQGQGVMLNLNK